MGVALAWSYDEGEVHNIVGVVHIVGVVRVAVAVCSEAQHCVVGVVRYIEVGVARGTGGNLKSTRIVFCIKVSGGGGGGGRKEERGGCGRRGRCEKGRRRGRANLEGRIGGGDG